MAMKITQKTQYTLHSPHSGSFTRISYLSKRTSIVQTGRKLKQIYSHLQIDIQYGNLKEHELRLP